MINYTRPPTRYALVKTTRYEDGTVIVELMPLSAHNGGVPALFTKERKAHDAARALSDLFGPRDENATAPPLYSVVPTNTAMYEALLRQFDDRHAPAANEAGQ